MTGEPSPGDCPICQTSDWQQALTAKEMLEGDTYDVKRCTRCGLMRTTGDEPEDVTSLYQTGGDADAGKRFRKLLEPIMARLRRWRVRQVSRAHPGQGKILDVGCGRGVMLKTLRQLGWDVYGTEIDAAIAESARAILGDRILVGAIEDLDLPMAPLDVVTFWHVLEHLPDPRAALTRAGEVLAPDGAILIAIPNADSWQARLFGRDWLHLDVPRHRWHFSDRTLGALAREVGLEVTHTEHFSLEYGPYGMLQSGLAKAGLGHSLFTRVLRPARRDRPLWREPLAWLHLALAAPITAAAAVSLPLEAIAAANGRGGCIMATLTRRRSPSHDDRHPSVGKR